MSKMPFSYRSCYNYWGIRTYAVPILVKGQGAMPGVEVHSNDGALSKTRGELHFVPLVLEETFEQIQMLSLRSSSFTDSSENLRAIGISVL